MSFGEVILWGLQRPRRRASALSNIFLFERALHLAGSALSGSSPAMRPPRRYSPRGLSGNACLGAVCAPTGVVSGGHGVP